MAPHEPTGIKQQIGEVAVVVLLWTLLFELNHWLFSFVEQTPFINWVFLPAALRMVAVLLLGWRGVAGLFLGALLTNQPELGLMDSLTLSALSSATPWLAVVCARCCLNIAPDLAGLSFGQLLTISTIGALSSATLHNAYFSMQSANHHWVDGFVPMFVGDMVGTLVVLYLSAAVLRRLPRPGAGA